MEGHSETGKAKPSISQEKAAEEAPAVLEKGREAPQSGASCPIWCTVLAGPVLSSDSEIPELISRCANTSVSRLRCLVSSPNSEYTDIFFFFKKKFQLCDLGRTPPPDESFRTQLPKGVEMLRDAPAGLVKPPEGPR